MITNNHGTITVIENEFWRDITIRNKHTAIIFVFFFFFLQLDPRTLTDTIKLYNPRESSEMPFLET
jgi:hypothetical protein